jgi:hypothetical protein
MQGTVTPQRARSALRALMLIGFVLGPGGCSSTSAARVGGSSGNLNALAPNAGAFQNSGQQPGAIAQSAGECNQTDSTVSCCLKKHPGDYERCGAIRPNPTPPKDRPNPWLPPGSLTPDQRTKRKKQCQEFYEDCIAVGGEFFPTFGYGSTHCQLCYDECYKTGQWPAEYQGDPCPGGPK